MKSLYNILGLGSASTPEHIEIAYASLSKKLDDNEDGLSAEDVNIQRIAIREAYQTLSDPIQRLRYDQKLASLEHQRTYGQAVIYAEADPGEGNRFGFKWVALIGLIVLCSLYFYNQNRSERERLRIEHEQAAQMSLVQEAENSQQQQERTRSIAARNSSSQADERKLRQTMRELDRDAARARQLEERSARLESRQEELREREARQKEQEQKRRQAEEMARAKAQLASDKRRLQQMELDRYGKIITE